jgi:hypothetical protein
MAPAYVFTRTAAAPASPALPGAFVIPGEGGRNGTSYQNDDNQQNHHYPV